jgi:hypothetical protein
MRLNLGCGYRKLPAFINVDSAPGCQPDQVVNLETLPWPWPDNAVDEVYLSHVLEHLGADSATYLGIIKELWRVCKPDARITVIVPHPRSDNFITDPTHVRPITPAGLSLFDQTINRQQIAAGDATTPLGLHLGVNFVVENTQVAILEPWATRFNLGEVSEADMQLALTSFYNVLGDLTITLRAVKP